MANTRETRAAACEIKFVIDDKLAPRVKEWARTNLQPDPHGSGVFRDEYRISTLYFDTRRFDVFHRNDSFGRAKYRVRRYGDADSVFFERKLRKPGVLIKRRTRDDIETLDRLADRIIDRDWAARWFQRRLVVRNLRPVCQVSYHRTARVAQTAEGLARLTLDSGLRAMPIDSPRFEADSGGEFLEGRLVLELKYYSRVPALFRRLVEEFALVPETASKYRLGMATTGYPGGRRYLQVHGSGEAAYA
jgi:hypothetical protein